MGNIKIAYGEKSEQYGELYLPKGKAKGLVLMIHGGYCQSKFTLSYLEPANLEGISLNIENYCTLSLFLKQA